MQQLSIAHYLRDYGVVGRATDGGNLAGSPGDLGTSCTAQGRPAPGSLPMADIDPHATYEAGFAAGRAAADADAATMLEQSQCVIADRLATERRGWCESEAALLEASLREAVAGCEAAIAAAAAKILKPFLTEQIRQRAIAELAGAINGMLEKSHVASVSCAGPADLVAMIQQRLSARGIPVEIVPGGSCEVRVRIDASVLETRLAGWLGAIEEAAG